MLSQQTVVWASEGSPQNYQVGSDERSNQVASARLCPVCNTDVHTIFNYPGPSLTALATEKSKQGQKNHFNSDIDLDSDSDPEICTICRSPNHTYQDCDEPLWNVYFDDATSENTIARLNQLASVPFVHTCKVCNSSAHKTWECLHQSETDSKVEMITRHQSEDLERLKPLAVVPFVHMFQSRKSSAHTTNICLDTQVLDTTQYEVAVPKGRVIKVSKATINNKNGAQNQKQQRFGNVDRSNGYRSCDGDYKRVDKVKHKEHTVGGFDSFDQDCGGDANGSDKNGD